MKAGLGVWPWLALLAAASVVLVVLYERAIRRDRAATERAEAAMPPGHPDSLGRMLLPTEEMAFKEIVEGFDLEAAG